jgi:carbon storage regulator
MLVLARRTGERVFMGPDIVITVLEAHPGMVRLGFDAPSQVRVLREELVNGRDDEALRDTRGLRGAVAEG